MNALKITLLVILLVITLVPTSTVGDENTRDFDAAPFAAALTDALGSLFSSDYQTVASIADQMLNASVPSSLEYIHVKTWRLLREFSLQLRYAEGNTSVKEDTIYRLYREKIEVEEVLPQYIEMLVSHIHDSSLKYKAGKTFELYLNRFDRVADEKIIGVTRLSRTGFLRVNITAQKNVYAGSDLPVTVYLPHGLRPLKVRVIVMTSTPLVDIVVHPETVGRPISFDVKIPGAENYTYSYKGNPGRIFVIVSGLYNGSMVELFSSTPLNIMADRPKMYFQIPSTVMVNHTLSMIVNSIADTALNANISIFKPGNSTPILRYEEAILPGRSLLTVPTQNLEPGFYTLKIHILPKGRYVERTYYKGILVEQPEIRVSAPSILIGPPFSALVKLDIRDVNTTGVIIVKGASTPSNTSAVEPGYTIIHVNLGWTALASTRTVLVEFHSQEGGVRAWRSVRITSINMLSVIAIAVAFSSISSISAQGLRVHLERLSRAIGRMAKMAGEKAHETAVEIYREFLSKISKYGAPGEAETLREFLGRIREKLRGTRAERALSALQVFILAYEQYLYSRRKPGLRYLKHLYRELARRLR